MGGPGRVKCSACSWDTGGIGSVFARRGCQKTIAVDVGESWGNYGT